MKRKTKKTLETLRYDMSYKGLEEDIAIDKKIIGELEFM